jgi:hypothetical protein
MYRRIIKVLNVRIELVSNTELIYAPNYFSLTDVESLLSDYASVEELPVETAPDGSIVILDEDVLPSIHVRDTLAVARGPFGALEKSMQDKRYTLLGNQGLLYRFIMYILEKKYSIYSFHANALYNAQRDELLVVFGGAASGKSPALMAGLHNGLKVFGTELVHFSVESDKFYFYQSSCLDNIRPQSIHDDFPELLSKLAVPDSQGFSSPSSKFLLDMRHFAASSSVLTSPRLRLIVPRVEAGRDPVITSKTTDQGLVAKMLFDNLAEKIAASFTMYHCMASNGFDSPFLAMRRLSAVQTLLRVAGEPHVETYIAPAKYFLEVLQ